MLRSRPRLLAAAVMATLAAVSCGGENPAGNGPAPATLLGTWSLESLALSGMPTVPAPSGPVFTATFEAERVGLRADCNVCGASYAAGLGTLAMGQMACTLVYCPSAPFDTDFAGLVQQAATFTIESERLVLRSSAGTVTLRR